MREARSAISDVVVQISATPEPYTCVGCRLRGVPRVEGFPRDVREATPGGLFRHLLRHVEVGDMVPVRLLRALAQSSAEHQKRSEQHAGS